MGKGDSSGTHQGILPEQIRIDCELLGSKITRGDLGSAIAGFVLAYSPRDVQRMKWNFSEKISTINPGYRKQLDESITGYLQGTYQIVRRMHLQGGFASMQDPAPANSPEYWNMVALQCSTGDDEDLLRFLKYLLAGFSMLVQGLPGHPVGMPFPGGDRVDLVGGIFYCPVRTKANEVDSALCPFCPALQTPEIGYLRPPVNASGHRKQEFIRNCYDFHNFNG